MPALDAILTGRTELHLSDAPDGQRLQADAAGAFAALRAAAASQGFDLRIASGFRSFAVQQAIWDAKLSGQRAVLDDCGVVLDLAAMEPLAQLHAVLRYSALPGASRHHWGTDLDVYDARALPVGYRLRLTPDEWGERGLFAALDSWLTARIAGNDSCGFFRPYVRDCGGVAPEPWHLSFAPLARDYARAMTPALLAQCLGACERAIARQDTVLANLPALFARYVGVAPA